MREQISKFATAAAAALLIATGVSRVHATAEACAYDYFFDPETAPVGGGAGSVLLYVYTEPGCTATDPDGTPLTYSATSLPPGLSMSSSGLITGTIAPGAAGGKSKKYTVTVSVSDGHGTVKASFTWTSHAPLISTA